MKQLTDEEISKWVSNNNKNHKWVTNKMLALFAKEISVKYVLWLNDNVSEERESLNHIDFNKSNEEVASKLFDVFANSLKTNKNETTNN